MLQCFCSDEYWDQVYSYATDIANAQSISTHFDTPTTRKRRSPAHLQDSIITESVGSCQPSTVSGYFKASLYLPVIDKFIVEINE